MGVLEWESQGRAVMGWGRLQPRQALPRAEGAPQRWEALTAVGFLQEGPRNQPQARHWLARLGTQASGIISFFLLRCSRDPDKGWALRKSPHCPTTAEETGPRKGTRNTQEVLTETPLCTWGGLGSQG